MKKTLTYFSIIFLFPLTIIGQPKASGCDKIKNGTFYFYPLRSQKEFVIIRDDSIQKEIDIKTSDTSFWKVEWVNNCHLNLKFIRSSQSMSNAKKSFFNSHITVVEVLDVTKDYYIFKGGLDSINNANILTDTMWLKAR
jgi:hypothetical protein